MPPGVITDENTSGGCRGAVLRGFVEPPADDLAPARDSTRSTATGLGRAVAEWLVVLVCAVSVALLLRILLFQAFWIPSESMENTLRAGDRVLVNKLSYAVGDVTRGDVVVFRRPAEQPGEIRDLIKRVVGVEGDVVEVRAQTLFVNGRPVEEAYLDGAERMPDFAPVEVPTGHVFVMGDNRDASYDSRFFGPVASAQIVGRAFVLFWPPGRADLL
jgi:signal peptidase I